MVEDQPSYSSQAAITTFAQKVSKNKENLKNSLIGLSVLEYITTISVAEQYFDEYDNALQSKLMIKKDEINDAYRITDLVAKDFLIGVLHHKSLLNPHNEDAPDRVNLKHNCRYMNVCLGECYFSRGIFEAIQLLVNLQYIQSVPEIHSLARRVASMAKGIDYDDAILGRIQDHIGYVFKYPSFIALACFDKSSAFYLLTFLGEGILQLLLAWFFFRVFSDEPPAPIAKKAARFNNHENYAAVATRSGLIQYSSQYVIKGKTEEAADSFLKAIVGAIYLDNVGNLDHTWNIIFPILDPFLLEYLEDV